MAGPAICAAALVLMLDGSRSISPDNWTLQVQGHAEAVVSDGFLHVVESSGPVALQVITFAETPHQVMPWTVVRNRAEARAYAASISRIVRPEDQSGTYTAMALKVSLDSFQQAPCQADNQVVDIVTDGKASDIHRLPEMLERAQEEGVTVNTLAVGMVEEDLPMVRETGRTHNGFVMEIEDWQQFGPAIARKIRLEITMNGARIPG